jgi:hypothetical protein
MIAVADPLMSSLSMQKDLFYAGAYETGPLGDLISLDNRSPLSNAIDIEIFRSSFKEIFQTFIDVGTFESYLTVFRKIFGTGVGVTFTVPAPGKLTIAIVATGTELQDFIARYIENNLYVFDEVIDWTPDNIAFQTIKGFQSQYELEQMLFEMVPAGIFTSISLTLGA